MSKDRTPRRWRRGLCNVPPDNHEVVEDEGPWLCRSCDFIGNAAEAIAHVIANQFTVTPREQA
jgi:hypothetical protein